MNSICEKEIKNYITITLAKEWISNLENTIEENKRIIKKLKVIIKEKQDEVD